MKTTPKMICQRLILFLYLMVRCLGYENYGKRKYPPVTIVHDDEDLTTKKTLSFGTKRNFIALIGDSALIHTNWIQLNKRSYKIYNDKIDYQHALQRCVNHHPESQLAVVTSYKHSQILGKHLLMGTPRLANAWIGARWYNKNYQFEPETIILKNTSDSTGFPPWKYNKIQKSEKCILLDSHLANITVFLEANCLRLRPYICYIENNTGFTDLIREDHGYRLHYSKRNWTEARDYCKDVYKNYSGHLVETKDPIQLYDLLRMMTQKEKIVQRVWLGGIFNTSLPLPKWVWDTDNEAIPIKSKTRMRWNHKNLYQSRNIIHDSCAALENSEKTYGMPCYFVLSYVCQFSAKSLKELQDVEKKKSQEQSYCKRSLKPGEKLKPHLYTNFWKKSSECIDENIRRRKYSPFLDWIKIDQNLYRIFTEEVSYKKAKQKCFSQHPDAQLAYVPSLNHAQILKEHLLAKIPYLNATWIGEIWDNKKEVQKIKCLAFNQHGLNDYLFIEANCKYKYPFLCSTENGTGFTDLIIDNYGYRLHHNKKIWNDARDYCRDVYLIDSAQLVEMKMPIIAYHLSKLMEKHGRIIHQVWLGGKLYKIGKQTSWFWDNSCEKVVGLVNWNNKTKYLSSMDDNCMVMDVLENIYYAAACEYELNYVCQFSADHLRSLQKQEKISRK